MRFGGPRKRSGFTLVETMLALVIVAIIAGVAAEVLVSGLNIYKLVVNRNNAFQTARMAMDRIVDEVLMFDEYSISWLSNTRIGFWDQEGASTDFERRTVTQGGRSVVCIYRGDDYLAGNVTQMDFDFYNASGASTAWSWLVRRINIEITVTAPDTAGSVHLRTDVFPRKFMYSDFQ